MCGLGCSAGTPASLQNLNYHFPAKTHQTQFAHALKVQIHRSEITLQPKSLRDDERSALLQPGFIHAKGNFTEALVCLSEQDTEPRRLATKHPIGTRIVSEPPPLPFLIVNHFNCPSGLGATRFLMTRIQTAFVFQSVRFPPHCD